MNGPRAAHASFKYRATRDYFRNDEWGDRVREKASAFIDASASASLARTFKFNYGGQREESDCACKCVGRCFIEVPVPGERGGLVALVALKLYKNTKIMR